MNLNERPTIAELEKFLNSDDRREIRINPDGSVEVLNEHGNCDKKIQELTSQLEESKTAIRELVEAAKKAFEALDDNALEGVQTPLEADAFELLEKALDKYSPKGEK